VAVEESWDRGTGMANINVADVGTKNRTLQKKEPL